MVVGFGKRVFRFRAPGLNFLGAGLTGFGLRRIGLGLSCAAKSSFKGPTKHINTRISR